jgi:hypothetical protein
MPSLTFAAEVPAKAESDCACNLLRRIEKLVSQSTDVEENPLYILSRIKLAIEAFESDIRPLEEMADYISDEDEDEVEADQARIDEILGLDFETAEAVENAINKTQNEFSAERAVDTSFRSEFNGWLRRVACREQIRTPLHCGLLIQAIETAVMMYLDAIWVIDVPERGKPDELYELATVVSGEIAFNNPELYASLGVPTPQEEARSQEEARAALEAAGA